MNAHEFLRRIADQDERIAVLEARVQTLAEERFRILSRLEVLEDVHAERQQQQQANGGQHARNQGQRQKRQADGAAAGTAAGEIRPSTISESVRAALRLPGKAGDPGAG